ncbi:hypothetical protein [Pseudomonas sp. zjy_11]|uniref:hypothetical protein n=1 Tax=unclassified Pseudomonas TaxID=196821 RepID=UPI00370A661B
MKKLALSLSLPLIVFLSTILLCQSAAATSQVNAVGETSAKVSDTRPLALEGVAEVSTPPKTKASDESELKILKEKNRLISEFQSSMLSIVLWALSAVVSTVLLLVGASLFTNFKLHDKELLRIKEDYDGRIKILKSEIEASLAVASREIAAAQEIRSQQDLDRMLDQASQVRSHFEAVRGSLESKFDEVLKSTTRSDAEIKRVNDNLVRVTMDLRRAESLIWDVKEIPVNHLISSLQGLDAALLSNNDYHIDEFVDRIKGSLQENFIDKGLAVDEEILSFFERRLTKLAEVRPEGEKDIRALLALCTEVSTNA